MPTRLICRAEHPDGRVRARGREPGRVIARIHGTLIQEVPWSAEPTGRILDRWEHVEDDERVLGVRCSGCKLITEYRIDRGDPPTGAQR